MTLSRHQPVMGRVRKKKAEHPLRQCKDCPTMFRPGSAVQVRCRVCQDRRKRIQWREREHERTKRRRELNGPVKPEDRRYLWKKDFLEALPAMRAELARQLAEGGRIHVEGADITFLDNRRNLT